MMKQLGLVGLAAVVALSLSGCSSMGGGSSRSYVSDAVDIVPTTHGNVRVVASTDPPGYWVFPDGTRWPMGYAPREVPLK